MLRDHAPDTVFDALDHVLKDGFNENSLTSVSNHSDSGDIAHRDHSHRYQNHGVGDLYHGCQTQSHQNAYENPDYQSEGFEHHGYQYQHNFEETATSF